jgi:L-asparagine transporter-like permease
MKKFQWPFFFLAILVVAMFISVGFAIALRSVWLIILFIVLGFFLMGFGISLKRKQK